MTYSFRKKINNVAKNWGNHVYDGLGDILTKEISMPKAVTTAAACLALTGCIAVKPKSEISVEKNQPVAAAEPLEEKANKAPKFIGPLIQSEKKETPTVKFTPPKEESVKKTPRPYLLGEIFDSEKPNKIAVQGNIVYDKDKNPKDINREIIADLRQNIGNGIDLRVGFYNNYADCFRQLKSAGETAVHTTDFAVGLYKQITDNIKAGITAEYIRQVFENSGTQNQKRVLVGPSLILDYDKIKAELNIQGGEGDGRFKDGSRFSERNIFQATGKASAVVSKDLGTVLTAMFQYGRADQEQLGTDWHYSPDGRAVGIQLIQTLLSADGKGNGIDLAVYGGVSIGSYDIGPHADLDPQRISAGLMFRLTPADIKKFTLDAFLGVYSQDNHMNQKIPGIPKKVNGVEAGLILYFESPRGNKK